MDSRVISLLILIAIVLLGYLATLRRVRLTTIDLEYAENFLADLDTYGESQGDNEDVYVSLTRRSNKMQNALGSQGVLAQYRPPNENRVITNLPVVLNMLPQLHTYFGDEWLRGRPIAFDTYTLIRDSLLRYLGTLEEHIEVFYREMLNPFSQLQTGIEIVIMAPIDLLSSFGILSTSKNIKIHKSALTRFFTGVMSLITLASSVVTILIGWPVLSQLFK